MITLRDQSELQAISGELDSARGLADTLRSQNHEAANRLHTVVSLIEMGSSPPTRWSSRHVGTGDGPSG